MKRARLIRLLTGTVALAIVISFTSCKKETEVKPKEEKTTSSTDAPNVNGGGSNPSAGTSH
ncbi:hypothetical protein [Spirosoma aerophilum]